MIFNMIIYITMNSNRIKNTIYTIICALAMVSFISCDDADSDVAYTLDGIWQGTIQGGYYDDRYGYSGQWSTEIQFITDGYAQGYGTEVDYSYYYNRAYRSDFNWEVQNGYIYLYYYDGYTAVIADYDLYARGNQRWFRGYFQDYYTGAPMASFDLVKVANWGSPYYRAIESNESSPQ